MKIEAFILFFLAKVINHGSRWIRYYACIHTAHKGLREKSLAVALVPDFTEWSYPYN